MTFSVLNKKEFLTFELEIASEIVNYFRSVAFFYKQNLSVQLTFHGRQNFSEFFPVFQSIPRKKRHEKLPDGQSVRRTAIVEG